MNQMTTNIATTPRERERESKFVNYCKAIVCNC